MKKSLQVLALVFATSLFSQVSFHPYFNYSPTPFMSIIYGPGTIYYTTDGSDPNFSSLSITDSNVNIPIPHNLTIKARVKLSDNTLSAVYQRNYYTTLPEKKVFFKPAASWGVPCSFINMIEPSNAIDFFPPGQKMTEACEGWYQMAYLYGSAEINFNNCSDFGQTPSPFPRYQIIAEDTVYYDASSGPITNPPACLLATQETSKIANVKLAQNPVKDVLLVNSDLKFETYQILDFSGKIITQGKFKKDLNVSQLLKGTYLVKLVGDNSVQHYIKFIKN
ncbi:Por secretion system C-terminal sorting domain-containing protein [Soonwooa buanensis]|uniref:Por secretion system C-terminal sorting domain-containing protein n=1 Tax=Soonwooa buanensis TaxID=619805 RepID=A0A1T5G7J8_9FLAO|nr:chitobiase/beta-hexosaminidase C-terminal domain-containing protein [Soonwooa buanensis]SKC04359.1 Por secretion system C-terminal sorting domain-containing protein [Soonwooa buanensis]